MIQKANRMCPYCGKEILGFHEKDWKYGSPIRICKRCRKKYLDLRYHEIAIDGIAPGTLNVKQSAKTLFFGLAIMFISIMAIIFISIIINLGIVTLRGHYYIMLIFLSLIGLLVVLFMLIDIIRIKTGIKERHLEKLKMESEKRLQDPSYIQELLNAGIQVPDNYI